MAKQWMNWYYQRQKLQQTWYDWKCRLRHCTRTSWATTSVEMSMSTISACIDSWPRCFSCIRACSTLQHRHHSTLTHILRTWSFVQHWMACLRSWTRLVLGWVTVRKSCHIRTLLHSIKHPGQLSLAIRDGPNVRLWHSAEAEGLGRLTERVPNNFGRMLCAVMKQRPLLVSALSG